jgi:hypothetical protein
MGAVSVTDVYKKECMTDTLNPKTDEELKQLAQDILMDKVFTDRHLRNDNPQTFALVFMPFAMANAEQLEAMKKEDIGMVYEYLSEAGPRSINGLPTFFSCKRITKAETDKVFEYYEKFKKALDQAKKES